MSTGARTPEELETLFEDALVARDREALAALFDEAAVLAAGNVQPVRGSEEIVQQALATWTGDHTYVADPRGVLQTRDIALVVAERGVNVVRRSRDGTWRYAIVFLPVDDVAERRDQ